LQVDRLVARAATLGMPFFRISGVTGEGVAEILEALWRHVVEARSRGTATDATLALAEGQSAV
jgi:hypothetical protein